MRPLPIRRKRKGERKTRRGKKGQKGQQRQKRKTRDREGETGLFSTKNPRRSLAKAKTIFTEQVPKIRIKRKEKCEDNGEKISFGIDSVGKEEDEHRRLM